MSTTAPTKLCTKCGIDCSGKPRTKDAQGRYMCKPCFDAVSQKAAAPKPAAKIAPKPVPVADAADDAAMMAALLESAPAALTETCPSCGNGVAEGNVICTICGYNKETGKAVSVKVSKPKRDGPGLKDILLNPKYTGLATGVVLGGLFALGFAAPIAWALFMLLGGLYVLVFSILIIIDAFRMRVLDGILTLIVPLYMVYYVLSKCERPMLKMHGCIGIVTWVGILISEQMMPALPD